MHPHVYVTSLRLGSALWVACLGLMWALAGVGCRSLSGPASASFASVTIKNHTAEEIAAATAQVFGADAYRGGKSPSGQMLFEKEASRATTMSRDGLVAAHEGAQTLHRVRVEIVPLNDGSSRLQCQAFVVTGAGDSFFEDEVRLTNARSRPYQSLLNPGGKAAEMNCQELEFEVTSREPMNL